MLKALKILSLLLKNIVFLAVVGTTAISGYTLWYNGQVYAQAENVRSELYDLKPSVSEESGPGFDELREINPDVVAWLTVDDTNIDYPVVQGESNMTYMNTDIYGKFSLAGSIFLDSRNNKEFNDRYSIIYGHHMENHGMFGDLELFRNEEYFNDHRTATILTDEGEKEYQVLAYAELPDSVRQIFDPSVWKYSLKGIDTLIREHCSNIWESALDEVIASPTKIDIVVLVTCASGSTGTRTVLFLTTPRTAGDDPIEPPDPPGPSDPPGPDDPPIDPPGPDDPPGPPPQTGDSMWNSPIFWAMMMVTSAGIMFLLCRSDRRRRVYQPKHSHDR